jgi:Leucine-rich repeat (LRR) protein
LPESIKLLVNLTDINVSLRDIDLGCLSRLCGLAHLNKLVMACDVMTNVSALSRLTQLKSLTLHKYMSASPCSDSGSEIGSVVGTMTNLEELSLFFMNDTNVDWISNLVNLTSLDLTGVIGIEYVRHLTKLVRLCVFVYKCIEFDLEPLRNLTDLKRLRVRAVLATVQAVPLLNLTKLVALMLMAHRITDVGVVWSLVNLEQLKLHGNIQTIRGIEALTKLKSLDLESTNLMGDVDALKNLTTLTALNVSDNHITDATCLTSLVNLQTLDVSKNSRHCHVHGLDALPKIKRIRR